MSFNSAAWLVVNRILVPISGPASQFCPVFFNTPYSSQPPVNTWNTVNISDYVPANTVAIHLTGLLLLTHGTSQETADLRLHFRRDASQSGNYIHQVVETSVTGGQRSPMACWVPLTNEKTFDWKWNTQFPAQTYPTFSAYGANLKIDAIGLKDN